MTFILNKNRIYIKLLQNMLNFVIIIEEWYKTKYYILKGVNYEKRNRNK